MISCVYSGSVFANNKAVVDSLHIVLNNAVDDDRVDVLNLLSEKSLFIDVEQAGRYAKVAAELAHEISYSQGEADGYINLAKYFVQSQLLDSATFAYLEALVYYESTNRMEETAKLQDALGTVLLRDKRYSEALDYFVKGLLIRQELGLFQGVASSYRNMGKVMELLNEPTQAMEYYLKSLENINMEEDKNLLSDVYLNCGVVQYTLGDYRKANEYYSEAMIILIQNDNQEALMNIYMHLGNLSIATNDLSAAIVYHNMSLDIAKELRDFSSISTTYVNLGDIYGNKLKEYEKAKEYLDKGITIAKKVDNRYAENRAYKTMANIFVAREKYKEAYNWEAKYSQLNDSLVKAEAAMQIEKSKQVLQMQRDKLKDNTVKINDSALAIKTTDGRMTIVLWVAGVTIAILFLLLLRERSKF
ncbi:tetratricopeptide repeat protein [Flavobacteriales bacterium]|nr:tetratricopeptide repeat protein [Flavobacteriales bacterium]